MGRTKQFSRQEVLEKALPLFWEKGFANTCLQELEKVTGVNKSGLYSEFEDKTEIFIESLKHYVSQQGHKVDLMDKPLGWKNIRKLFAMATKSEDCNPAGCFMVNSLRELSGLPKEAHRLVRESREKLKLEVIANLEAEKVPRAEITADLILTFFFGLAIEQNLKQDPKEVEKKIADFLKAFA